MSIPAPVIKTLYAKSGNRCAFPNCNCLLTDGKNQSEMAHIISAKPKGPRHIPNYNNGNYDTEDNIILLCPNHHSEIDFKAEMYPANMLREMKKAHETWVKNSLTPITYTQSFINEFISICQKNHINKLLTDFSLSCHFDGILFEYSDNCYNELSNLLNKPNTVNLPKKILIELTTFTFILDSYAYKLAHHTIPNHTGMAVSCGAISCEVRKETDEMQLYLRKIYTKYRYNIP